MKKILLFLCFFLSFVIFADVIPGGWETDISRAKQRAATEKKPIMLIISGPASDAASRILKKDVIANSNFDKAAKKYAVCLIIYTNPGKKQNKKDLKLQKTFAGIYKGTVPCYAVVDSKLKLLAIPGGKKAYDFIKTLSDVREKNGGRPIPELKKLEKENLKEKLKESKKDKNKKENSKKDKKEKSNRKSSKKNK